MKKIVLVVLMAVMITTPCLAKEIEPEGMFSIEGTVWQALPIGLQIFPLPRIVTHDFSIGFYGGKVYPDLWPDDSSLYIDMLVCSIFSTAGYSISTQQGGAGGGTARIQRYIATNWNRHGAQD